MRERGKGGGGRSFWMGGKGGKSREDVSIARGGAACPHQGGREEGGGVGTVYDKKGKGPPPRRKKKGEGFGKKKGKD